MNKDGFAKQEGLLLLGLTQKDYTAWERLIANDLSTPNVDKTFWALPHIGSDNLGEPQFSHSDTIGDYGIVKHLEGCWIKLALSKDANNVSVDNPPYTYSENAETPLKIIGTPVVASPMYFLQDQYKSRLIEANAGGDWAVNKSSFMKDFVAVIVIKVEKIAQKSKGLRPTQVVRVGFDGVDGVSHGYSWKIYQDQALQTEIFSAEVIETGGYPTGITNTLTGMSIDPSQYKKSSLPFQIINERNSHSNDLGAEGRLLGVFPTLDRKGSPRTIAYFAMLVTDPPLQNFEDFGKDTYRGIIRSWSHSEMVSDFATSDWEENFSVDEEGFTQFKQKRRLGLGVVIDGGLGVVHAKGFRANPRPVKKEHFGMLQVFGSSSYPYTDFNVKKTPIHLASILDTTEFIDDVYIASPKGALIFEDARGAQGLSTRLKENSVVIHSHHSNLPSVFTNDALFPYNIGGILFRGTGSVKYERGYNALSAKPINATLSGFLGKGETSGLKGAGIPNYGKCLLLPKGPLSVKGSGKLNWGGGTTTSSSGASPSDIPLYEWTNGHPKHRFAFSVTGAFSTYGEMVAQESIGHGTNDAHELNPGSFHQGSRKVLSRIAAPYNVEKTFRVSEGMIVENTTNGTFHAVGEVGRRWIATPYRSAVDPSDGLGNPYYDNQLGYTKPLGVERPANQGSRVLDYDHRNPYRNSLFYDINPYFGYRNSYEDPALGGGDRTDTFEDADSLGHIEAGLIGVERTHVRNSVQGHNLRLTPNVEFVPILGKHGVDGGLLLPRDKVEDGGAAAAIPQKSGKRIEDADAIFYSMHHNFKSAGVTHGAGDIGKFLYICGTEVFQYTGWWVVIDVIDEYRISMASPVNNEIVEVQRSVAVLRKWQRDDVRGGDPETNRGALPLENRAPTLRMTCSNLWTVVTGVGGINSHWFDKLNCSDMVLVINGSDGQVRAIVTVPSAVIAGEVNMINLVALLNADATYNGVTAHAGLYGGVGVPFIKWTYEGNEQIIAPTDGGYNGQGGMHGTISVTYDLSVLSTDEVKDLVGHEATLFGTFFANLVGNTAITHSPYGSRNIRSKRVLLLYGNKLRN